MNVAPRYLGRGSWLARRDPRVLILVAILTAITVPQVWDLRIAIPLLVIAQVYYRAAAIPFEAVKGQWIFVFVFLSILILFNTIITQGEVGSLVSPALFALVAEQIAYSAAFALFGLFSLATAALLAFSVSETVERGKL